jgi:hypothetical protein
MAGLWAITIAVVLTIPSPHNRIGPPGAAEDWPFGAWLACAAGPRAEITTDALRVPDGVVLRVANGAGDQDPQLVLVPIRSGKQARRFLAALGCRQA